MTGFFDSLSAEQKAALLAYRGPENHGDPVFRLPDLTSAIDHHAALAVSAAYRSADRR